MSPWNFESCYHIIDKTPDAASGGGGYAANAGWLTWLGTSTCQLSTTGALPAFDVLEKAALLAPAVEELIDAVEVRS
jgi:hypothetical protein